MVSFVVRRVVGLVFQVLLVVMGIFVLLRLMPADPASKLASLAPGEGARQQVLKSLGIDVGIPTQLGRYLEGLVQGDLGVSWKSSVPITTELAAKFPVTIQLIVLAFILALLVAIPIGRAAAMKPNGKVDRGSLIYSLFAGAQPDFLWGLILIYIFATKLGIFPIPTGLLDSRVSAPPDVTGFILIDSLIAGNTAAFSSSLLHLVLPVVTLAFILTGPLVKMTRQSVLAVSNSDYLLYAKAVGLPAREVKAMMLKNALSPILTLTGILFGFMLGGAVLVEYVFALPGVGLYSLDSTLSLDYPAVQGAVLVMTSFSLLIYLVIDIVHALVDPRITVRSNA